MRKTSFFCSLIVLVVGLIGLVITADAAPPGIPCIQGQPCRLGSTSVSSLTIRGGGADGGFCMQGGNCTLSSLTVSGDAGMNSLQVNAISTPGNFGWTGPLVNTGGGIFAWGGDAVISGNLILDGGTLSGALDAGIASTNLTLSTATTLCVDPANGGVNTNTCVPPSGTCAGINTCATIQGALNRLGQTPWVAANVTIIIDGGTYNESPALTSLFLAPPVGSLAATITITGVKVTATLATGSATGTATATSAGGTNPPTQATMTDGAATWTINDLKGRILLYNSSSMFICSNTATVITLCTNNASLSGTLAYTIQDNAVPINGTGSGNNYRCNPGPERAHP